MFYVNLVKIIKFFDVNFFRLRNRVLYTYLVEISKGFKKFDTPHIYFLWQGCLLANHPRWFRCHRHNLSSPLNVSKPYSAGHVMRKQQLLRVFPPNFFWLPLHALRCRSLLPRQCFQQGLSAEWGVHIRPSHSACMSSGISMLKLWNCRHVPGA